VCVFFTSIEVISPLTAAACFGFLLSFYTNTWVNKSGYIAAYGAMPGISGGCPLFFIPLFFWSKSIRQASMKWSFVQFVFWKDDREVGEWSKQRQLRFAMIQFVELYLFEANGEI
jgi:hypothetical protein